MKQGYRNIDLIVDLLAEADVYRPELTRDPVEAERRRSYPSGNIINEQQGAGLEVALSVLRADFGNQQERDFAYSRLSEQMAIASFHLICDTDDVMRRRLLLPRLAYDEAGFRETKSGLRAKVLSGTAFAAETAHRLTIKHQQGLETTKLKMKLGRQLGNLAIATECIQLVDAPNGMSEFEIQKVARIYGTDMITRARTHHHDIGVHPSIAQAALPTTPASQEWLKNAPATNEAYEALLQAQRDFGLAA